uniref:Si:dkey-243i1.1 n=1 Tax=Takifugu rubripes TaxID=31033 RepID=A0A674MKF9_TAKRU
ATQNLLRKGEDRRNVFRLIMEYFVYYAPQLLFNEAIPAHPRNRAIRVPLPGPIVIENVGEEKPTSSDSYWAGLQSAVHFSFLSEERLNAAVKLAKRDLRRWHRESLTKSPAKASQEVDLLETTGVEEHQKNSVSSMFQFDHSPPTRDPGSTQLEVDKTGSLSQEVQKLLNELDGFIQKVEDLTNRGKKYGRIKRYSLL